MLDDGRIVLNIHIGEGVCPAIGAEQQAVALGEVAGVLGTGQHLYQTAVAVLAATGRDTFRDDGTAGIPCDVYHLGTRVGLLVVVGHGHRVELAHRVVAGQHAAGVLPGNGRASLDLGPRQFRVVALAHAALGHEIVDTAFALLVAWIPVLYGRVFHLGPVVHHNLDDGGVQLVLVAHGGGTPFEVAHIAVVVGHDERALELAGVGRVDAEVGRKLHGTAHPPLGM